MISKKPRKQRYLHYNAPLHKKRKWISSHLAENLLLKYDRRSVPVVKGDTVKVMRGNYPGHEEKISKVNVRDQTVEIEGVTITTAKGTNIAKPIHASTLLITKLNITDKWRRRKLESGLSETTKKEIEKEAAEQLKAYEAEQKEEEDAVKAEEKLKEETKEEPIKEVLEKAGRPPLGFARGFGNLERFALRGAKDRVGLGAHLIPRHPRRRTSAWAEPAGCEFPSGILGSTFPPRQTSPGPAGRLLPVRAVPTPC